MLTGQQELSDPKGRRLGDIEDVGNLPLPTKWTAISMPWCMNIMNVQSFFKLSKARPSKMVKTGKHVNLKVSYHTPLNKASKRSASIKASCWQTADHLNVDEYWAWGGQMWFVGDWGHYFAAMRTCQQRIPKFNVRANAAKTYKHLLSV